VDTAPPFSACALLIASDTDSPGLRSILGFGACVAGVVTEGAVGVVGFANVGSTLVAACLAVVSAPFLPNKPKPALIAPPTPAAANSG
jgi:hypothetical protein